MFRKGSDSVDIISVGVSAMDSKVSDSSYKNAVSGNLGSVDEGRSASP